MKVFSLQAPIYRGTWLSSRLTAQTSQLAAVRRDALERWRRARSRGLSAEEAARAVGASRASLYRWEKRLEPRSRRPHRQRQPTWTSALMRKIERLRADHPMWGKRKLAVLLRQEGIDVSVSMVRRIPECDVRDAPQGSDHVREERQGTRQISLAGLSRAIRGQKGGQAAPFLRSMPPLIHVRSLLSPAVRGIFQAKGAQRPGFVLARQARVGEFALEHCAMRNASGLMLRL